MKKILISVFMIMVIFIGIENNQVNAFPASSTVIYERNRCK